MASFLQRALLPTGGINKDFVMNDRDVKTLMAWYAIKARRELLKSCEDAFYQDEQSDSSVAEDEDSQVDQKDPNPEKAD
ncbi:hypothetical protein EBQ93_02430 [bacterium]|nr:hypothetical protein [bacterium]